MHIMTTNNYTERLNRTIESQYSGTKTVVNFIERLYGIQLLREYLITEGCGNLRFEAGLATVFDMQTIEQVLLLLVFIFNCLFIIIRIILFNRNHKLRILHQI